MKEVVKDGIESVISRSKEGDVLLSIKNKSNKLAQG